MSSTAVDRAAVVIFRKQRFGNERLQRVERLPLRPTPCLGRRRCNCKCFHRQRKGHLLPPYRQGRFLSRCSDRCGSSTDQSGDNFQAGAARSTVFEARPQLVRARFRIQVRWRDRFCYNSVCSFRAPSTVALATRQEACSSEPSRPPREPSTGTSSGLFI